jgi:hypothetical protein
MVEEERETGRGAGRGVDASVLLCICSHVFTRSPRLLMPVVAKPDRGNRAAIRIAWPVARCIGSILEACSAR